MISPPMASYDQVSPAAMSFVPEDEDAFWQLFDGVAPDYFKFDPVSGASSRAEGSMSDASSTTSGNSRPRTIESFLAAYATPAPSSGAPATPQVTPTLPSAAAFPTPFAPSPALFSTSPEAGKEFERPTGGRRELKRQRNTEASARFRLRKKQRENELESHAKHLEDEVVALRAEKSALERQVKVLLEVLGNVGRERRAEETEGALTPPPQ